MFSQEDEKLKEIEEKLSEMSIEEFEEAIEDYILNWMDEDMFWDDDFDESVYDELKQIIWEDENKD